jgi:hypothetical protein
MTARRRNAESDESSGFLRDFPVIPLYNQFMLSGRRTILAAAFVLLCSVQARAQVSQAISTPTYPVGGIYVSPQPNFNWIGPSTTAIANLGVGTSFYLQVSINDPAFGAGNLVVQITTPAIVGSTSVLTADGAYVSTFTLTNSTTYYWRVATVDPTNTFGTWSAVTSFVTDFFSPTAAGYASVSSTSGAIGETQWNNLLAGVTAQITVQDALSGLAISTNSRPYSSVGYGVMYTTTAGQNWIDASSITATAAVFNRSRGFARFNGKLFACENGGGIYSSADGVNWVATASPGSFIFSLAVFNGKLYAGDFANGKIYSSSDGTAWTAGVPVGTSIVRLLVFNSRLYAADYGNGIIWSSADGVSWAGQSLGAVSPLSLEVYNGKLYSGDASGNIYSTPDGVIWNKNPGVFASQVESLVTFNGVLYAGLYGSSGIGRSVDGISWTRTNIGANIFAMVVFNGKIYAGDQNGTLYASADGVHWTNGLGLSSTLLRAFSSFNGSLFVGDENGVVFKINPVSASITGADGTTGSQTLSATSLNLAASTNTTTCASVFPCGATNQVIFTASDLAGNVKTAGPFAVLVDTVTPLAISTGSYPADASFVSTPMPNFAWQGLSSTTAVGLATGSSYYLQVSNNDPAFGAGNIVISVSTPIYANTSVPYIDGGYVSTFTLLNNTQYYWRVAVKNALNGNFSPWSSASSFTIDFTSPTASAFASISSTSGVMGELQWNSLAAGVTAQIVIQDAGSGLAISTLSIPSQSDAMDWGEGTTRGYGVFYTTNAGQNWISWSTYTYSSVSSSQLSALTVYKGQLFAGMNAGAAIQKSVDGINWSAAYNPPCCHGSVYALGAFNGSLYAGNNDQTLVTSDGVSWSVLSSTPIFNFSVFDGRLYGNDGAQSTWVLSGSTWTKVFTKIGFAGRGLMPFNGRLYTGDGAGANIYGTSDGNNWSATNAGITVFRMNAFNGIFHAQRGNGDMWRSSDGINFVQDSFVGSTYFGGMTVFNGALYNSQNGDGKILATEDGTNWQSVFPGGVAGTHMASYNGRLFSGSNPGMYVISPVAASLTGTDGTTAAQTLTALSLNLVQSTNTTTCGGVSPCGATNQVMFTASDLAGNVKTVTYAILVDMITPIAISTPSYPANASYVSTSMPNFAWQGPSTTTAAGLGVGSSFYLQVSNNDPAFGAGNIVVSISTPIYVSTTVATADGAYLSTFTLLNNTKYYWRVAAKNVLNGNFSPWSASAAFTTDFTSPTATGYASVSSTSGAIGETQWNNLLAGVTVQINVQDAFSGLSVSTNALSFNGDGHDGGGSGGYGVAYTTNSGQNWIDYSTYTKTYTDSVFAFGAFNGKLYEGDEGGVISSSPDGTTWTAVYTSGIGVLDSLTTFKGRLYAGFSASSTILSSPDGTTWTAAPTPVTGGIAAMGAFNGRLYAGGASSAVVYSSTDGFTWAAVLSEPGEGYIGSIAAFNGKVFVGTSPSGKIDASADGVNWTSTTLGGGNGVESLAVYNGRLYAGASANHAVSGEIYSTADGQTWTTSLNAGVLQIIQAMTAFNGKLYASSDNSEIYMTTDGSNWSAVTSPIPGAGIQALAGFQGKLHVGVFRSGVYQFTPIGASLGGSDGTNISQTLSATSLNFVQSTNTTTCAGVSPCGATNQVIFTASDLAGNVKMAGPFAVLADTITPVAISTPSFPSVGAYVSTQPNFDWTGPSTTTAVGLGTGASYYLQVAKNDPAFGAGNIVISVSTPIYVSTITSSADGAYISTFTLLNAATYYWRVAAKNALLGTQSPWSQTASFVVDLLPPVGSAFQAGPTFGSLVAEGQFLPSAAGVAVQINVQDVVSGIAASTAAITRAPGSQDNALASSQGFGVLYSTNAGQTWIAFSTFTRGAALPVSAASALGVYADKLYVGEAGSAYYSTSDGSNWNALGGYGQNAITGFAVYQNLLYSIGGGNGTYGGVNSGANWSAVPLPGAGSFSTYGVAAFNGRIYMGAAPNNRLYQSTDGSNWTQVFANTGSIAVYNGLMYMNSGFASPDGVRWSAGADPDPRFGDTFALGGWYARSGTAVQARAAGRTLTVADIGAAINALVPFNGKLYASASTGVFELVPTSAALTGTDGSTAAQSLSATLNLAPSTNTVTCAGVWPCGATNQVLFLYSDLAGNATSYGPFAIITDTTTPVAISTPTSPAAGVFLNSALPTFQWTGPSTTTLAALGAGAFYRLQVAKNDSSFGAGNIILSTTAPVSLSTSFMSLVSTAPLAEAATFYWRVAAANTQLGTQSPWSSAAAFETDYTSPTASAFISVSSVGVNLAEAAYNALAAGVTVQIAVQDGFSGLAALAASTDTVIYSTNAGSTWNQVPVASLALTGAPGSTAAQILSAYGLNLVQSTVAAVCAGAAPCAATNQVVFTVSDRAANIRTYGPYAVLVDTTGPASAVVATTGFGPAVVVVATAADSGLAGVNDFNYEASPSPTFAASVSSSNYVSTTTWTFSGLLAATTYYVRVTARDNIGNVGSVSVSSAVSTQGKLLFAATDISSASVVQGTETPFLRMTLQTPVGGANAVVNGFRIQRLGTGTDADAGTVEVFSDSSGGVFVSTMDALLGSAPMAGGYATVALGASAQTITNAPVNFFVVYRVATAATLGATLGAAVASPADVQLGFPYAATGTFASNSGLSTVIDGPNTLTIIPSSISPSSLPPGSGGVGVLKMTMLTDQGTSVLHSLSLRLTGSMPSNHISAVRLYRDTPGSGTFNPGADLLMTSGTDLFTLGSATLTLTVPISSRTLTTSPSIFFVSVNVTGAASPGETFQIQIDSAASFALDTPLDTVALAAAPFASSTSTVQTSNLLTLSLQSLTPTTFSQGLSYAVLKATLTVDSGMAQVDRLTVHRSGVGVDSDVSQVQVYQHPFNDGLPFNPGTDVLLGQAPFAGGLAAVNLSTVSVTAGASSYLFVVYAVSPAAAPGDTLGASLSNSGDFHVVSAFTSEAGAFPFASSTGTIAATVNHLVITAVNQAPGTLTQGATNVSLLRLTMKSDNNPITLSGISLTRLGAGGDADISALSVYADLTGSGVLAPSTSALVSSGGDVFTSGSATLAFGTPQTITASTRTFFVAVSIAPGAVPGDAIGVSITTTTSFAVNAPNAVSTSAAAFPIQGGPVPITQYPNIVTVSTASLTPPGGASPGVQNIAVMKLTLGTDVTNAQWLALKVDRSGSAADADISALKIYFDINGVGSFNPGNLGQYLLVTPSTLSFVSGTASLGFTAPQGLTSTPKTFFLTVDLATSAVPGRTLVVRALDRSYFTVNAPNTVAPTSFASGALTIVAAPSKMDVIAYSSAPASTIQGISNVTMQSLGLWMEAFTGQWSQLVLTRLGTASDADLTRVRLYSDDAGTGVLNLGFDAQVASGVFSNGSVALSFPPQTISISTRTYFLTADVSPTAAAGATFGFSIVNPGSLIVAAPNSVSAQGLPAQSVLTTILPTQNGVYVTYQDRAPAALQQGATAQLFLNLSMNTTSNAVLLGGLTLQKLGTAADSDVARLRIYQDSNGTGILDTVNDPLVADVVSPFHAGAAAVPFTSAQSISPAPQHFLITLDADPLADYTKSVGIALNSASALTLTAPNYAVNAGFPMTSSLIPITKQPDVLRIAAASLLTANLIQGSETPVLELAASAARQGVTWDRLRVAKLGALADVMIDQVRLYRDVSGRGIVDGAAVLIGTATMSSSSADIGFSSAQSIGVSTANYLVTFVIDINATVGATVGAGVLGAGSLHAVAPDLVSSNGLPYQTSLFTVIDAKTPATPTVVLPGGGYSHSFESIQFIWTSTVVLGAINSATYAIGTSTGATDVRAYTAMPPAPGTVTVSGLLLSNGATYYVTVKAGSTLGFTSQAGGSAGVLVDTLIPTTPTAPNTTIGQTSVLLAWSPSTTGPSGLRGYLVEYRRGDSPEWFNAKTKQPTGAGASAVRAAGFAPAAGGTDPADLVMPPFSATNLPAGTLFFRLSAVSNSSLISPAGPESRVLFGPVASAALSGVSAFPNPFDSRLGPATIVYTVASASEVTIDLYSIYGRKVRSLSAAALAGTNTTPWDGADSSGRKVSKGIYLAVIKAGGAQTTYRIGVIH